MKNTLLAAITLLVLNMTTIPLSNAADAKLPSEVKQAIDAAVETENTFVLEAVTAKALIEYPDHKAAIEAYLPAPKAVAVADEAAKQAQQIANAEAAEKEAKAEEKKAKEVASKKAAEAEEASKWSGTMEGLYERTSGNTKSQELRAKVNMEHDDTTWRNRFGVEGRYATEDGETIKEDYAAKYGLDYKLSKKSFIFGEAEYVVDEFSGYEYRLSESIGAGYREEWPLKKMSLDMRASIGARHFKEDTAGAKTEHEILILKPEATYKWQVQDNIDFTQKVGAAIGEEISTAESETSITYKLNDRLGLKFAFEAEYISEVPAGTKKLDTFTSTGLTYKLFE